MNSKKYLYVKVKYDNVITDKLYSYISDFKDIKVGDKVYVQMQESLEIATVKEKKYYNVKNVPYPVYKTKHIIEIIDTEKFLTINKLISNNITNKSYRVNEGIEVANKLLLSELKNRFLIDTNHYIKQYNMISNDLAKVKIKSYNLLLEDELKENYIYDIVYSNEINKLNLSKQEKSKIKTYLQLNYETLYNRALKEIENSIRSKAKEEENQEPIRENTNIFLSFLNKIKHNKKLKNKSDNIYEIDIGKESVFSKLIDFSSKK